MKQFDFCRNHLLSSSLWKFRLSSPELSLIMLIYANSIKIFKNLITYLNSPHQKNINPENFIFYLFGIVKLLKFGIIKNLLILVPFFYSKVYCKYFQKNPIFDTFKLIYLGNRSPSDNKWPLCESHFLSSFKWNYFHSI